MTRKRRSVVLDNSHDNNSASDTSSTTSSTSTSTSTSTRTSYDELYDNMKVVYSKGNVAVFYPTYDQFVDFNRLVDYVYINYNDSGIVKIIPPSEWSGYNTSYDNVDSIKLHNPIRQNVIGNRGVYRLVPVVERIKKGCDNTIGVFRDVAKQQLPNDIRKLLSNNNDDITHPNEETCSEIERKFWRSITYNAPMYAADTSGQLFDESLDIWNVAHLPSCLNAYSATIHGTNTPYLYVGQYKSMFGIHTEDQDLFSINYIHTGAPKQWYSITPSQANKFEELARNLFYEDNIRCKDFLRHKHTMISPHVLKEHNIDVNTVVHYQHEFIITFPRAYHFGYNIYFNIAESLNFAQPSWIPIAYKSTVCKCRHDNVKIYVDIFQQQIYEWLKTQSNESQQWHYKQLDKYNIQSVTWYFNCCCLKHTNVNNLSQLEWLDKPTGYMFQCACCSSLNHIECYRRYKNRTALYYNCELIEHDDYTIIDSMLNDMVYAIHKTTKHINNVQSSNKLYQLSYDYYKYLQQRDQYPMYCYRCLPLHRHINKIKLLDNGNEITALTRRYTHYRQRQIALLSRLELGGKYNSKQRQQQYDDNDTDSESEINTDNNKHDIADNDEYYDNDDGTIQTIDYSSKLTRAGTDISTMIDNDLCNPFMPSPNKDIKIFLQYQKNIFTRLKLLKNKYQQLSSATATATATAHQSQPAAVNIDNNVTVTNTNVNTNAPSTVPAGSHYTSINTAPSQPATPIFPVKPSHHVVQQSPSQYPAVIVGNCTRRRFTFDNSYQQRTSSNGLPSLPQRDNNNTSSRKTTMLKTNHLLANNIALPQLQPIKDTSLSTNYDKITMATLKPYNSAAHYETTEVWSANNAVSQLPIQHTLPIIQSTIVTT